MNGYANGDAANQRWPRQQPLSSSAVDLAYTEEDFVDPLMENRDAGEGKGTARVELPYTTLRQMQLEREDQSHQEACDKYSKVCTLWYGMVWYGARDAGGGEGEMWLSVVRGRVVCLAYFSP